LVGSDYGNISRCYVTGTVNGSPESHTSWVGGLVGVNNGGSIVQSHAAASVKGGFGGRVGGLVGVNEAGSISSSFATGSVTDLRAKSAVGGLVGENEVGISDSYATGAVTGRSDHSVAVGGLVGRNDGSATVTRSYATGAISGLDSDEGGLIGLDGAPPGNLSDTYWDTDTSGITDPSQGAGNVPNDPGITGLTTVELQSGLPSGFDPKIWSENANINGGLPYLLANPPPK
jgi:hypothetical protein